MYPSMSVTYICLRVLVGTSPASGWRAQRGCAKVKGSELEQGFRVSGDLERLSKASTKGFGVQGRRSRAI